MDIAFEGRKYTVVQEKNLYLMLKSFDMNLVSLNNNYLLFLKIIVFFD